LAIDHINDNEPLLIANADQIFDDGIESIVDRFKNDLNDAACATFSSVHPRWSYIKTGHDGLVIEAAEKRPISRNAIAGLYLYKHGSDFCKFAMESIKCSLGIDGSYYISLVFNQYVLAGKKVGHYSIKNDRYHTFYSPQKIEEYELGSGAKVKQ
jgi:dTDP-glucose pyrophosphorylase